MFDKLKEIYKADLYDEVEPGSAVAVELFTSVYQCY